MRSKASIKGHPIHPALIPFPIAFLIGAFVADALGVLNGNPTFWAMGGYLAFAGIVMAFVAAVPGLVDYIYTVPPRSSAKKRGTFHMIAALGAVALFGIALASRGGLEAQPQMLQLLLEAAGSGLLGVAGWMGGTLAFRNQIGVDHRYANSGKWNAMSTSAAPNEPVMVARESELEVNQMKFLRLGARRIVLGRTEDGFVAFDDHCTHKGGSLAGGVMMCGTVHCPWHGSQFDVTNGRVTAGPATKNIGTYAVVARDGAVWLDPGDTTRVAGDERTDESRGERQVPISVEHRRTPDPGRRLPSGEDGDVEKRF